MCVYINAHPRTDVDHFRLFSGASKNLRVHVQTRKHLGVRRQFQVFRIGSVQHDDGHGVDEQVRVDAVADVQGEREEFVGVSGSC